MADWPDPIPGILPFGTLTIFAGAPSVGKTTMLLDWMRRWRDGRTICGYQTHPPTAFYYICADRGLSQGTFHRLAGNSTLATFYSVVGADSRLNVDEFQKPTHGKDLLLHCMAELEPIPGSHVIIDPLSPLFISGHPNSQRDVAASLIRLSRMIEERQINITGTAHFGKQKADRQDRYRRPQDRISGSGAFSGFSDTQIYLVEPEPPQQPYSILGWNPRYRPPEEFKFTRHEGWFVPWVLDQIGVEDESDAARLYRLALELGPVSTAELCAKAIDTLKISRATFYRLLRSLLHDRRLKRRDDHKIEAKVLS